MPCNLCDNPEHYKNWEIKKFPLWTIYIHPNQCYLGRCFIVLNRHLEDFFDISKEEMEEYFSIIKELRDVIRKLFHPDLLNYAILQNNLNHVHLNFIPRYKKPRVVGEIEFTDPRWSHNYSPYDKNYKIPDKMLSGIRDSIRSQLLVKTQ